MPRSRSILARSLRKSLPVLLTAALLTPLPAMGQWAVYDNANHIENILQSAPRPLRHLPAHRADPPPARAAQVDGPPARGS